MTQRVCEKCAFYYEYRTNEGFLHCACNKNGHKDVSDIVKCNSVYLSKKVQK